MTTKTDIRRDAIREIDAARSLRAELANMTDDTDAIRDTLEGETDLPSVMRALLLSIDEDQVLVDGLDGLITVLKSRHDRLEARIEAKRGLIEQAMAIAERKTLELDIGTLSMTPRAPKVIVLDEAAIPAKYFKAKPTLDKKLLKAALEVGPVPGAEMSNGGVSLNIRRV